MQITNCLDSLRAWTKNNVRPWCILGQGPSFDRHESMVLDGYLLFALNRTVKHLRVQVAHFIDIKALIDCQDIVDRNANLVILPWYPHVNSKATAKHLADFVDEIPVLRDLVGKGKLASYNSSSAGNLMKNPALPNVRVKYFSGCAAFALLGMAGAKDIRTLGIDGGASYSGKFSGKTLLDNGQKSFDIQFREIDRICKKRAIARMAL